MSVRLEPEPHPQVELAPRPHPAGLGADRLLRRLPRRPVGRADRRRARRRCSRLTALSDPGSTLWRSCEEASPDGSRVVTVPLLIDGPLSRLEVHAADGELLDTYRAAYAVGTVSWEDDHSLLLVTHGTRKSTIARCEGDTCERASRLVDAP